MSKIWVDFNNMGVDGVRLNCNGTLEDIDDKGIVLTQGLELTIWFEDLSAESTVMYSSVDNCWVAQINNKNW
jgi:hypothetical protein